MPLSFLLHVFPRASSRAVARFAALALALSGVVGCGSSTETPNDEPGPSDEAESDVRASCTNPRAYFATYGEGRGTCEPIAGVRGQWLPKPLFADAPADVQTSTCKYEWSGERYSRPDRDAIASKVGWSNGLAASCGPSSNPDVGALTPIPALDDRTQAGSVGCDVCGVLRNGKLWVVLPAEKVYQKQFQVKLSNGETRAFQIQPTEARALSIELPPPPPGTRYKSGRVQIL